MFTCSQSHTPRHNPPYSEHLDKTSESPLLKLWPKAGTNASRIRLSSPGYLVSTDNCDKTSATSNNMWLRESCQSVTH